MTILAILGFAAAVALGLLIVGPFALRHVFFGQPYAYGRFGLALIGVGMGLHLASGALNQAALARDRARAAACCWLAAAVVFLGWMLSPVVGDQLLRAEVGYAGATALLVLALALLYRQGATSTEQSSVGLDRRGDRSVGLAGIRGAEDRRARHEDVRPGLTATWACPGIDPAVHLDRNMLAHQRPHPWELVE